MFTNLSTLADEDAGNKPSTSGKGNLSELKVMTAYVQAGFVVSVPFGGGAPYDLVVDTGVRLLKVQVKTGRLRNGCIIFPMRRFNGRGGSGHRYSRHEIDIFAIYCPDNDHIYILEFIDGLNEGRLRCAETQNKQQQKIRWARDYEFDDYVKRWKGEVELVGLEPTTSAMPSQRSSN